MPFNLRLSAVLRKAGWKVKVFDNEGTETPHITILCKTKTWRMSLRTGALLFPGGRMKDLPEELIGALENEANWEAMKAYWDEKHGDHNPVGAAE